MEVLESDFNQQEHEMNLLTRWERDRDQFEVLSKAKFNELCREKQLLAHFSLGLQFVWVVSKNKWIKKFELQRWVIGQLVNGHYVCCDMS